MSPEEFTEIMNQREQFYHKGKKRNRKQGGENVHLHSMPVGGKWESSEI
jgi:hypothetical protein